MQFLVPATHAAQPPGTDEACAVADELDEACPDRERTYLYTLVPNRTVYEDNQREEQKRKEEKNQSEATSDDAEHRAVDASVWRRPKQSDEAEQSKQQGEEGKEQASEGAKRKEHRQEVHELQAAWVSLHEVDTGNTRVVNLLEELAEVCPTLVPNPGFGEETAACAALVDAQAQVNILAEAHRREAFQLAIEAATNAKIEGARIELLVHLLLAATNAARRQEGGHTVTDGLLHRREAFVSSVWPTPSVASLLFELIFNGLQVAWRQDAIAVEEDKELALTVLCAIVARQSWATVLLRVVAELQLACIAMDDALARLG